MLQITPLKRTAAEIAQLEKVSSDAGCLSEIAHSLYVFNIVMCGIGL